MLVAILCISGFSLLLTMLTMISVGQALLKVDKLGDMAFRIITVETLLRQFAQGYQLDTMETKFETMMGGSGVNMVTGSSVDEIVTKIQSSSPIPLSEEQLQKLRNTLKRLIEDGGSDDSSEWKDTP